MDADVDLSSELTTMERIEHLLTVVACALTGKQPQHFCPWTRSGIDQFVKEVTRGR